MISNFSKSKVVTFLGVPILLLQTTFNFVGPASATTGLVPGLVSNLKSDQFSSNSVSLTWNAPSPFAEAEITDYRIQYKIIADFDWTDFQDGVSSSTSSVVTGLTQGLAYEFQVAAINDFGMGDFFGYRTFGEAQKIVTGSSHTCALLHSSKVSCWGGNFFGQLGNSSNFESAEPTLVSALTDVTEISAGSSHNCALLVTGTVKCWGHNKYRQVGDGSSVERRLSPVQVYGISNAESIATGSGHSCALLQGGQVQCWGSGKSGELGNRSFGDRGSPVAAYNLSNVSAISAGGSNTCALLIEGTVKCWGSNNFGQLGIDIVPASKSAEPVLVPGLTDVTSVSTGSYHSCALLLEGTVKCWGRNSNGELGIDTALSSSVPVLVPGLTDVIEISSGSSHSCALLIEGAVKCWGNNSFGQMGNGFTSEVSEPVLVSLLSDAVDISAGSLHSCAVMIAGAVNCWGSNGRSQLGMEASEIPSTVPVTSHYGGVIPSQVPIIQSVEAKTQSLNSLEFSAHLNDAGGQSLDRCIAQYLLDGEQKWLPEQAPELSIDSEVITGLFAYLPQKATVKVRIACDNPVGRSLWIESESIRLLPAPIIVSNFLATKLANGKSVELTWIWPAENDVYEISGFKIQHRTLPHGVWVNSNGLSTIAANTTSLTVTNLSPGTLYEFRIAAINENGASDLANFISPTAGTGKMTFSVESDSGAIIKSGQFRWSSTDGKYSSATAVGPGLDGKVIFAAVAPGPGQVTMTDGILPNGTKVSGTWSTVISAGSQTLAIPLEPIFITRKVQVTLPSGVPVPGALVNSRDWGGLAESGSSAGFWFIPSDSTNISSTDNDGFVVHSGYQTNTHGAVRGFAQFSDGVLSQVTDVVSYVEGTTILELNYMPYIESETDEFYADAGNQVIANFIARDSVGEPLAGQVMTIRAPSGVVSALGACKPTLTGISKSDGTLVVKLCAAQNAKYIVSSPGSVGIKEISVLVRKLAPQVPASITVSSPVKSEIRVTWTRPRFDGGTPITSYKLKSTCTGLKPVVKTVGKTKSSYTFTKMPKGKRCTIEVQAQNTVGLGKSVKKSVLVKK
jgi:alpha-tubulin suppressor-like RCC1 family protein